jgi:DNA sulfur modification protein DndD
MIFKKLELKNWIAFQEADINFSTKKNKNITLIRGNNKGGKTAILRAIRWALYGNTGDIDIYKKPLQILNRESYNNGSFDLQVSLEIRNGNSDIKIIRSLKPKKGIANKPKNNDFSESFSVLVDGSAVRDEEQYIKELLDEEVADFFMFDGENLKEYQKLSNNPSQSKMLQSKIEKIIRRPYLKSARDDLEVIHSKLRSKINSASNDDILKAIEAKLEILESVIAQKESDKELSNGYVLAETEKLKEAKAHLDSFGAKNDAVLNLNIVEAAIPIKEEQIKEFKSEISNLLTDSWKGIIGKIATLQSDRFTSRKADLQSQKNTAIENSYLKQLLESSLKQNKCLLCDENPLTPQKKAIYKAKLNQLIEDSDAIIEDSHSAELESLTALDSYKAFNSIDFLSEKSEKLDICENELATLMIRKEDCEQEVGKQGKAIAEAQLAVTDTETELARVNSGLKDAVMELDGPYARGQTDLYGPEGLYQAKKIADEAEAKYSENQPTNADKEHLKQIKLLKTLFEDALDDLSIDLKDKVQEIANRMNSDMTPYESSISLEINDHFGLQVLDGGGMPIETSAAGNQIVGLSLIHALKEASDIQGPLLIDTPVGRVDLDHRAKILESFSNLPHQVIMLVHSGEIAIGSDLEKIINPSIGAYYEINKEHDSLSVITKT